MKHPNEIPRIAEMKDQIGSPSRENPYVNYVEACRAKYGSKVYAVDRFAEVFQLEDNMWAIRVLSPIGIGGNWTYLIEGPEKALLIDTGYGVGNLKGLCEELVPGKEILCAVTHYHVDHSSGVHQWAEVHCHKFTADVLEYEYETKTGGHLFVGMPDDRPLPYVFFEDKDVIPFNPPKFVRHESHDIINLGGDYDIEIIHMGGHAPGLSCYLDKKSRALYTGDAVFESLQEGLGIGLDLRSTVWIPHCEYLNVFYLTDRIKELADRIGEYDVCRDGHGSIDSANRVVTDLRDALEATIKDPYAYTKEIQTFFGKGYIMQRGIANCRYSDPATVLKYEQPEKPAGR